MKILMVTNTYFPIVGGLEKSIESFSAKFRQWGHEVIIAVPELEGMERNDQGIIQMPALHAGQSDFSLALPIFSALTKVVDSFQPDVIHTHHPFLMGEMALRLAARYAKPLVFTYHIMFDQYSHYLPVPSYLGKRFLVELAVGFANMSTRVIAPSESVRKILQQIGVQKYIHVVPTGVEIEAFAEGNGAKVRQALGISAQDWVLGYVGRLAPEKNLEFLADGVIPFMKANSKAHFVIAGKGPSQGLLEKLFLEAGLKERLHMQGVMQGKDLADCYHAMDAFVFASKSETQGMVLCEAMAAGVPVIALDAPGAREVVKDFENGRLLKRENKEEFQDALTWCFECDSHQWKKLQENAKKTARIFSMDTCAKHALKVYEAALADDLSLIIAKQNEWRRWMRRFRAEWNIMANFGRATRLALGEMAVNRE